MTSLAVADLTKSFGSRRALDGVTFEVAPGEVFGFVGSNGAGKTTTMRIALGVLEPDSGQVLWDRQPITWDERRQIGYMPEERGLYPKMAVGEQLQYLAELHGMSPASARASMQRWTDTLGIAERRGDEVQKLSLGNQQRVQLAAALVHDPLALIHDEPFSGLDPVAVDVMSAVLHERAAAGVPVVFSSHQLDLVERLCHRVGIISAGRMVSVGTVDELRHTDRPRFVVDGAPPSIWLAGVPGAVVLDQTGSRATLEVPGGDGQDVLAAALAAGPVHEFAPARPSLTDLFRHVVTADAPKEAAL